MKMTDIINNKSDVKHCDLILYSVSKREITNRDFTRLRRNLNILKEAGKDSKGKLLLTFDGYDNDSREIYMIDEIRDYIKTIWEEYKYLFYFLTAIDNNRALIFACLNDFEAMQLIQENKTKLRIININEKIRQQTIEAMTKFGLAIDDVDGVQRILFSFI